MSAGPADGGRRGAGAGGRMAIWRIAGADLSHDWQTSAVGALVVAVALAPLLILAGLWFGVVETMRLQLASDPANLELRHHALPGLPEGFFEAVAALPETGFVTPRTRYVNLQVRMVNRADIEAAPAEVILAPTAAGDPVMRAAGIAVPEGDAIVLGERAAEALRLAEGDSVTLALRRIGQGGQRENATLALTVAGVLPAAIEGARKGYAPLAVLADIQAYQEWIRVAERGWPGRAERGDAWGGFRLYARSIDDVEPLRRWLLARGIEVASAADRIAFTERVDRDLGRLFYAIFGLTLIGYVTTVGLAQIANVAQKRRALAVLRLVGYRARAVGLFPVLQAGALALVGSVAALIVYHAASPAIGALFRDLVSGEGRLMHLPATHAMGAVFCSVAVAMLASSVAARRAMTISPAETFRDA